MGEGRAESFADGSTVVRRDMVRGEVWTAAPLRVLHDRPGGGELLLAHWPGIEVLASTTWIDWLAKGDEAARKQAVQLLVDGGWRLAPWAWRTTAVLGWFGVDEDFSVHRFRCPAGRSARCAGGAVSQRSAGVANAIAV